MHRPTYHTVPWHKDQMAAQGMVSSHVEPSRGWGVGRSSRPRTSVASCSCQPWPLGHLASSPPVFLICLISGVNQVGSRSLLPNSISFPYDKSLEFDDCVLVRLLLIRGYGGHGRERDSLPEVTAEGRGCPLGQQCPRVPAESEGWGPPRKADFILSDGQTQDRLVSKITHFERILITLLAQGYLSSDSLPG